MSSLTDASRLFLEASCTQLRGIWTFFRPGAASRRDRTIVAWHEVPGKVSPRDPSRRVRRDRRYRDTLVADGNTEER